MKGDYTRECHHPRLLSPAPATHLLQGSRVWQTLVFLTNRTGLDALMVGALYRSRWEIELLLMWCKGNRRMKHSLGTSGNAVKTQLFIAISVYMLVAILGKRLAIDTPLYTML